MSTRERDFAMALAMLAEGFGERNLTPVRIEAYHRSLEDVSIPLLNAAVDRLLKEVSSEQFRHSKLPLPGDWRLAAEKCRREIVAAHPYDGCIECEDRKGWVEVTMDGVKRMRRCACLERHRLMLEGFGATAAPLALPPAERVEAEA